MNNQLLRDRVAELLAPILIADGLDLEAVELTPIGRTRLLRVVVDADGGVSLDRITQATRAIDKLLEAQDVMGQGSFRLEVTSPGVDRPLTEPRHWRRNLGRLVKVTPVEGTAEVKRITGRIAASDDTGAELEIEDRKETVRTRVEFADVAKARIQVEFKSFSAGDTDDAEPGDELADELAADGDRREPEGED